MEARDIASGSLYIPQPAEIINTKDITGLEKLFEIRFIDGHALGHNPGQFVQVSILGIGEAPVSITSSPTRKGSFELCVRRVGNVTNALHRLDKGSIVGIRGPFGNGVDVERFRGKEVLIVAGGLGLAPVRSFINYILARRDEFGPVHILYGTKNPKEILFRDEVEAWEKRDDIDFKITVDCGDESWCGCVGVVTVLFKDLRIEAEDCMAITCGPPVMYKFVVKEMLKEGIPKDQIYLSLERRMKCGMGVCGHCQINNRYVCIDGPVFNYAEIQGLEEAL
jgi:sulfhydrogenase subunit gamma (sulfur reductase)